jgi:hypothetical protein
MRVLKITNNLATYITNECKTEFELLKPEPTWRDDVFMPKPMLISLPL